MHVPERLGPAGKPGQAYRALRASSREAEHQDLASGTTQPDGTARHLHCNYCQLVCRVQWALWRAAQVNCTLP